MFQRLGPVLDPWRYRITVQRGLARTTAAPPARSLRRWSRVALRTEVIECAAINLRVMDREEMQALNARYRGDDRPTNVLAFPNDLTRPGSRQLLGDIALCAPVIAAEARAQGKPWQAHWAHMVVHGTLHLLGYVHDTQSTATRMETVEIRLLERLGFPDPYQTVEG